MDSVAWRFRPETRLNFRTLLITFFAWAPQLGYLPKNTPTAAEDLPTPKAEDDEIEIYAQAELQKLFDRSDKHTLHPGQQWPGCLFFRGHRAAITPERFSEPFRR